MADVLSLVKYNKLFGDNVWACCSLLHFYNICLTGMTKYIQTWKRNGWKLTTGGDVKNQKDLKELDVLLNGDVNVTWVSCLFLSPANEVVGR